MQRFCKKCKKIEVKKSNFCRKCSIQNTYAKKIEKKISNIITNNDKIINARLSKTSHHNIEVDFKCSICDRKTTKLYNYFLKKDICRKCSASQAAKKRHEEKYGKNIDKIKKYLETNNIVYSNIELKKDFIYSEISVKCDNCNKNYKSEFYRIQRFYDANNKVLCKECKKQESNYKHGCSVSFYTKNIIGNDEGYFYSYSSIIEGKKCYKIGITRNDIIKRVKSQCKEPKDIVYIK